MSEGLSVPPSFFEPLPPPGPRKHRGVVIGAVVFAVFMGLVALGVALSVITTAKAKRNDARDFAAASRQMAARLEERPDSEALPTAKDGTKRYVSPAPDANKHAFHVTLPRGWGAHHLGIRTSEDVYVDSVLSYVSAEQATTLTIERVEGPPQSVGSEEFQAGFREGLASNDGSALRITSRYVATRIGGEDAYYFDGTKTDEGVSLRMRVFAFQHGDETFFAFFRTVPQAWPTLLPQLQRILASWGYGD